MDARPSAGGLSADLLFSDQAIDRRLDLLVGIGDRDRGERFLLDSRRQAELLQNGGSPFVDESARIELRNLRLASEVLGAPARYDTFNILDHKTDLVV